FAVPQDRSKRRVAARFEYFPHQPTIDGRDLCLFLGLGGRNLLRAFGLFERLHSAVAILSTRAVLAMIHVAPRVKRTKANSGHPIMVIEENSVVPVVRPPQSLYGLTAKLGMPDG